MKKTMLKKPEKKLADYKKVISYAREGGNNRC